MSLERFGYLVRAASHGEEALRLASSHQGPIDLLVTDVVMPHMSGRDLAESLRRARPTLKVPFVSGYTNDTILRQGILTEQTPFPAKPFTPTVLAQKVRHVLDKPTPLSAES